MAKNALTFFKRFYRYVISIGNSMICSDISKLFETSLKYHE